MKSTEAEEHLRVIRSLMERSAIYRAISAPTALIGALLSLAACALEFWLNAHFDDVPSPGGSPYFLSIWLVVLLLTVAANTALIWRSAKRRAEPFFSANMKMAAFCSFPAFVSAFAFTLFVFLQFRESTRVYAILLPPIWIFFYGLALLSTAHFAPRSMIILGWCFLITALFLPFAAFWTQSSWLLLICGNFLLGVTFGLFHVIYACCIWPRKDPRPGSTAL